MASMFEIAAARCSPSASADGSLKDWPEEAVEAGAGDGVAGGWATDVLLDAGAAGAAGVWAGCAGVDGSAGGFGAAFGCLLVNGISTSSLQGRSYLRRHAHNEALLLDLVRLDSVVILKDLARVDELLC